MKVKNISKNIQIISWIPCFQIEEIREVEKEIWEILLKNPNFKEIIKLPLTK